MELPGAVKYILMICFLIAVGVAVVYDIYALSAHKQTVSSMLWATAKNWPMFPFIVGALVGHLFWR